MKSWKTPELIAGSLASGPSPASGTSRGDVPAWSLAYELAQILVPVVPEARFRRQLQGDLVREAGRRPAGSLPHIRVRHRTRLLVGAAAIGSLASLAGVLLALLLRNRGGRATHAAAG